VAPAPFRVVWAVAHADKASTNKKIRQSRRVTRFSSDLPLNCSVVLLKAGYSRMNFRLQAAGSSAGWAEDEGVWRFGWGETHSHLGTHYDLLCGLTILQSL